MADPKYANLPGIDHNSPDVYETSELPESEQQHSVEDESDAVEKLGVDAKEAFGKFKDKSIDGKAVDFSDRVSRSVRTGYDARTEYELAGLGAKETPLQKFQRLQSEIQELAEEVNQLQATVKSEKSNDKTNPVVVAGQVEYLQNQLTDLHLEKTLGPDAQIDLGDPQGALHKRLLTHLDAVKTPKPAEKGGKPTQKDGTEITYELHYKPEQAKFTHNARLADLDQRLERMEALIGQSPEKMSALTSDTDSKSILGAVQAISARSSLLEPDHLDSIEGRLQALSQRLAIVTEKKGAVEEVDKQNKVSELYELVKRWEAVSSTLPEVVDRMSALKELHEQAMQFSHALTHLDTSQQSITTQLSSHGTMLKQLEGTFKANIDTIKANCASIDSRIKAISK
ncbi:unnamed protein product [Owenia fusiformis]|uniref:Uncharacterized protein n=1 Tax=Owenia fusiformis TaxID=6347 RepID=A0A8J1UYP8_OWEFU|nr:unnamed protein product [Owenia fusiformis]